MKSINRYLNWYSFSDLLPKKHPTEANNYPLKEQPFFVVGSGRNGSTMLGSMLNMHPDILLTPEQFALPYAIIRYGVLNFLKWSDIVKIIVGEFARKKASLWNADLSGVYDPLYEMPKEARSLQAILDHIFKEYGKVKDIEFKIWGDKTPQNTLHMDLIHPVFPNAKYVFLIRDGRDVLSSYNKAEKKHMAEHANAENAVKLWNQSIETYDYLLKNCDATRLHIIRYEDLVQKSEETLKAFCAFMNLPFAPEMLDFQNEIHRMGVADMKHHQNVGKKVNASSIGKWKTGLTEEEKTKFIPLIEQNLKRWEYV